jgi:fumarylacetoacetase
MVAQQTVTGCNLNTGDLLGSGTISGETTESYGSLIEMSYNGTQDVSIGTAKRTFLQDGDTVIMRAQVGSDEEGYIGFGDLTGTILPAHSS